MCVYFSRKILKKATSQDLGASTMIPPFFPLLMNVLCHSKTALKVMTRGAERKLFLTGLFLHSLFVIVKCGFIIYGYILHYRYLE